MLNFIAKLTVDFVRGVYYCVRSVSILEQVTTILLTVQCSLGPV